MMKIMGIKQVSQNNTYQNYTNRSTVTVTTEGSNGSGFLISDDGDILTCAHVVLKNIKHIYGKLRVQIFELDKTYTAEATVKHVDCRADIAILHTSFQEPQM